jgi:hypothetical protein
MRKILGEKPVTNHVNCGKDKRLNKENNNKFQHMRLFRLEENTELLGYDEEVYFTRKPASLTKFTTIFSYYHAKFQIKQRTRQVIYKKISNLFVPAQKRMISFLS